MRNPLIRRGCLGATAVTLLTLPPASLAAPKGTLPPTNVTAAAIATGVTVGWTPVRARGGNVSGPPRAQFEGAWGCMDRPIGILPAGTNDFVLPNTMVVLTREIIEAGLAPLPPGTPPVGPPIAWPRMPKPGVIMIPFVDGSPQYVGLIQVTPARYELYLTVERIP